MAKMKALELESLLAKLQNNAVGDFNGDIGNLRANLMRRYLARPYGDEVEGRSKVVDTSIRDVIESIKPELMDIFMGGDQVVDFTPKGEEDIEGARQETEVCDYIFQKENDGFMVLYSWISDALFQKNGYVKRYWDERKRVEVEEYDDLSIEEASILLEELDETSEEVEILQRSGGIDEETGQISPLYLKIRRTSTEKRYVVENVPPEEVLIHPEWVKVDLKRCPFVAHKRPMTVSDLVEMGFNRAQVEDLPTYDKKLESEEATVRHSDQDFHETDFQHGDKSMREVMVYENYVLCDYDGDGIAEQLRVYTGGSEGKILRQGNRLAIDQVTDAPFEVLSPLPIPHRHYGVSVAELIEDLQRIKTVMTRQLVDNVVGSNNPDIAVDSEAMTDETVTDLGETGLGRVIRIPGGMASIGPLPIPQTAAQSLAAIEYIDGLKESRTGVTRYNQGMDADSLNKTAYGMKSLMSAAQKKVLMIARIFAETGFKSLFVNMHRDLRAGPVRELALRLNNEFVKVNPRTWRHRTDVTVNVGLGTGDRDVQLARLMQVLAEQKEGFAAGIVPYEKLYHTYTKILELSGFKDVANFFPSAEDVQKMQAQQAQNRQPDPAIMLAQIEQQKNAQDAQIKAMDQQIKQLEIMMKDDRERDLAAAKIEADEAARKEASVDGPALTKQ